MRQLFLLELIFVSFLLASPQQAQASPTSKPTARKLNSRSSKSKLEIKTLFPLSIGNQWTYVETGKQAANNGKLFTIRVHTTTFKGLKTTENRTYLHTSYGLMQFHKFWGGYIIKYPLVVGKIWYAEWRPGRMQLNVFSSGKYKVIAVNKKRVVRGKAYQGCVVIEKLTGKDRTWSTYCRGVGLVIAEKRIKTTIVWKRELMSFRAK